MAVTWNTPSGSLGILTERNTVTVPLSAESDLGEVTYSVIAGSLPRGMRIHSGSIIGAPTEVRRFTESRFVVRATDGVDKKDRTFSLSVDGADTPEFLTPEGFLNVGNGDAYFILDNAPVDFQISATDPDLLAGDNLEFYIVPNTGELPPGLSLSSTGVISGFTSPIFAIAELPVNTGAYDTHTFDTIPLDIGDLNTNGFDSFFYDLQTYDYNEPSEVPKRLSRIYTFTVAVTDGVNTESRTFKIYVVTEEFLRADNNIVQVDTNLFQADSNGNREPIWITDSYLGRYRANNYVTVYLDVYDPPSLPGTIGYFFNTRNPDGTDSELPPGMTLDSTTGEIAGAVPYQAAVTKTYNFTLTAVNFPAELADQNYTLVGDWDFATRYQPTQAVRYNGLIYIALQENQNQFPAENQFWTLGVSTVDRTFSIDVIGEIESAITWISPSDRGTIKPNQPSKLVVEAESTIYGSRVVYDLVSGELPPGLSFLPTGEIVGKVRQFADSDNTGLTRFYERDSSLEDSSGSFEYSVTFDGGNTLFDKTFTFTVRARDYAQFAESLRQFTVTVIADNQKTFANLYATALQPKNKRLNWVGFITNNEIFNPDDLYRYGDPNFSVQSNLRVLMYAGIESTNAVNYVQAMSRNHYRKRFLFNDVTYAKAKDPETQETVYEVVYVNVKDEYEKNGVSISDTVQLKDNIESKVLISYDAISVDSDIPFASDADHQRIFPNSVKNMRNRIKNIGDRDREFLPLWMRSIQDAQSFEPGYTKALVLCFAKPGRAPSIIARIRANQFDFKQLDFESDRYIIDILDGEIEDKYLAFPQIGEKLP